MTSRAPRRVINGLSPRLACLALLAWAPSLLGYEDRAWAQVPVFLPRAELEPAAAAPAAVAPAAAAPAAADTPAAAAATPPSVAALPLAPTPAASVATPAKADVIREYNLVPVDEDDRDDASDTAPVAKRPRWYGWQTLAVDAVSVLTFAGGVAVGERDASPLGPALVWSGLLGYELGAGFVHFAHRNPGRGFASFGVRLGMPLAGAFLGASLASSCDANLCEAGGAGIGVLLGAGAAMAIDAALFAYDEPERERLGRASLRPMFRLSPGRAWLGLGGAL